MDELQKAKRIESLYKNLSNTSVLNNVEDLRFVYKELISCGEPISRIIDAINISAGLQTNDSQAAGENEATSESEKTPRFLPRSPGSVAAPRNSNGSIASQDAVDHPDTALDDPAVSGIGLRGCDLSHKLPEVQPAQREPPPATSKIRAENAVPGHAFYFQSLEEADAPTDPYASISGDLLQPEGRDSARWSLRLAKLGKTRGIIALTTALSVILGLTVFLSTRPGDERSAVASGHSPSLNQPAAPKPTSQATTAVPDEPPAKEEPTGTVATTASSSGSPAAAAVPDEPPAKEETTGTAAPTASSSSSGSAAPKPTSQATTAVPDEPPAKEETTGTVATTASSSGSESAAPKPTSPVAAAVPDEPPAKEETTGTAEPPAKEETTGTVATTASSSGSESAAPKPTSPVAAAVPDEPPAKEETTGTAEPPAKEETTGTVATTASSSGSESAAPKPTSPVAAAVPDQPSAAREATTAAVSTTAASSPGAEPAALITPATIAAPAVPAAPSPIPGPTAIPAPATTSAPTISATGSDHRPAASAVAISSPSEPATGSVPASPEHQSTGSRLDAVDRLSKEEVSALRARGDALFGNRDIISARLFYERAAEGGDGQAALQLGETYDPAFLKRAGIAGIRGDSAMAKRWYQQAFELGAGEAQTLLNGTTDR